MITDVEVEPAHKSDANALVPAIASVKERNLKTKEPCADSFYGSDGNCELAKSHVAELIAFTIDSVEEDKLSFADFKFSEKGDLVFKNYEGV